MTSKYQPDLAPPSQEQLQHNEAIQASPRKIVKGLRLAIQRRQRRGREPVSIALPRQYFASVVQHQARGMNVGSFGPELLGVPIVCAEDEAEAQEQARAERLEQIREGVDRANGNTDPSPTSAA